MCTEFEKHLSELVNIELNAGETPPQDVALILARFIPPTLDYSQVKGVAVKRASSAAQTIVSELEGQRGKP